MKNLILISTLLLVISCSVTKRASLWTKKYCNLERLEYQEIIDTVRISKENGIESGIKTSGKFILTDKLKLDTISANLKAGKKVFINQNTLQIAKVSQEFYENYTKNRTALCQIMEGMKSKVISSKEGKLKAEGLYLDIISMFSGINDDEKKSRS